MSKNTIRIHIDNEFEDIELAMIFDCEVDGAEVIEIHDVFVRYPTATTANTRILLPGYETDNSELLMRLTNEYRKLTELEAQRAIDLQVDSDIQHDQEEKTDYFGNTDKEGF